MNPHLFFSFSTVFSTYWASQVVLVVKNFPSNAGDSRDMGLISGLGRSPGGGNGNPLLYSCMGSSWLATVHRVAKSRTWLSKWAWAHTAWLQSRRGILYITMNADRQMGSNKLCNHRGPHRSTGLKAQQCVWRTISHCARPDDIRQVREWVWNKAGQRRGPREGVWLPGSATSLGLSLVWRGKQGDWNLSQL